ncbi:MAG: acetyl-CoA hydrolase/transferase C-terminal domain-containing protein [Desulfobacterales bacterium]
MNWREAYKRKQTSADDAVRTIKSGDRIAIGGSTDQPRILQDAIFARKDELSNVDVVITPMLTHPCWLEPGYEDAFQVTIAGWSGPLGRPMLLEKRGHGLVPNTYHGIFAKGTEAPEKGEHTEMDVFVMKVSPPNEKGIVSLGGYRWMKKEIAERSKIVIAEVDTNQQWFCGDTTMPMSEIDYFVEYTDPMSTLEGIEDALIKADLDEEIEDKIRQIAGMSLPYTRSLIIPSLVAMPELFIGLADDLLGDPPEHTQTISDLVSSLINDGDTIQLGQGSPAGYFARLGCFDQKHDLGVHSEIACRGLVDLVEGGVITGKHKTVHPGKAVLQGLDGITPEETDYCVENPKIEVYGVEHISDIKQIAAHDNFVSINNALAVDLTGQICFETIFDGIPVHGPGGQPDFHVGSYCSKGGRPITVLYSTAADDSISRIVPQFEPGAVVSVSRAHAYYVVTEYGVAKLIGKSLKERAEALISIAHPDFREELRKAAKELF